MILLVQCQPLERLIGEKSQNSNFQFNFWITFKTMKSFVRCCQCENSTRNEHSLSTRQTDSSESVSDSHWSKQRLKQLLFQKNYQFFNKLNSNYYSIYYWSAVAVTFKMSDSMEPTSQSDSINQTMASKVLFCEFSKIW